MKKIVLYFILIYSISNSNAQVGINTTNPTSTLDVNGQVTIDQKNFGGYGGLLIKGDQPGNNYPNIAFSILNDTGMDEIAGYIGGNINNNTTGNEAMDLSFLTSTNGLGGLSEKMRIKDNGNIGIGTPNPSTNLHLVSPFSNPVIFDGGSNLFISFAENGVFRGYFGSYAGNPEDIELGTYSGNLGAVHLTTNNTPKLTVINNGNVGIGTPSPTEKLDIAGKIKITDGTEGIGKVLVSDAVGVASWVTTNSIKSAVAGVFFGAGANIGAGTVVGVSSPSSYCNAYIDLPPGRWMVFGTYLINNSTTPLTSGQSVWVRCVFSLSNVASLPTSDVISGGLISGTLTGPNEFGIANGQTIIQNPNPIGGATKRYYVWSAVQKYGTTTTAFFVNGLGSSFWGENQLTAIPMN